MKRECVNMLGRAAGAMVVTALLAGCGGEGAAGPAGAQGPAGPPGEGAVEAGERLVPVVFTGDDGSSAAVGWHDTKLDIDCALVVMEGREMRCLPVPDWHDLAAQVPDPGWTTIEYYSDAECKTPIIGYFGPNSGVMVDRQRLGVYQNSGKPYVGPAYLWGQGSPTCEPTGPCNDKCFLTEDITDTYAGGVY